MAQLESNSIGGDVLLDVSVERDDGVFLGVTLTTVEGDEVGEYISTDPGEIAQFFREVRAAEAEFKRLTDPEAIS